MPITRRILLKSAVFGVCVLPLHTMQAACASGPAGLRRLKIGEVVFDARVSHALEFAQTARAWGAFTHGLYGDTYRRCRDPFAHAHPQQAAVAGLTDLPTLFLMQAMAADAGMRLILRVQHCQTSVWECTHEAIGEPFYQDLFRSRLKAVSADWAHESARLVMNLPLQTVSAASSASRLGEVKSSVLTARTMVTWVIG